MKTINVSDEQASIIAKHNKGDIFTFLALLKEQPPSRDTYYNRSDLHDLYKIKSDELLMQNKFNWGSSPHDWIIKLQYPKGTILGIRETWWKSPEIDIPDQYDADLSDADRKNARRDLLPLGWKIMSSATMPHEAIRSQYEVIGNEVKRVQDINIIHMMPYDKDKDRTIECFKQWFNAKYAKPRPVRKNGEIVKYVCYPYDYESFRQSKYYADNVAPWSDGTYEYKGLPLKIHARPFLNLVEARKK